MAGSQDLFVPKTIGKKKIRNINNFNLKGSWDPKYFESKIVLVTKQCGSKNLLVLKSLKMNSK